MSCNYKARILPGAINNYYHSALPSYAQSRRMSLFRPVIFSIRSTAVAVFAALLAACHGPYTYTFNDNVIYSPNRATDAVTSVLQDADLQGCLNQFLANSKDQPALADIKLLACPGGNVQTLNGIDQLSGLEQLELSDNKISDLRPLASLKNLRVLGLRNNPLTSVQVLQQLPLLRFVSLQGNNQLRCSELEQLKARLGNTVSGPTQCAQ